MLLYGPPGTGKTLLARAVAHHTDCTFIRVSGSELVQKYIGEGSRMVRELFVMARCGRSASCAAVLRRICTLSLHAGVLSAAHSHGKDVFTSGAFPGDLGTPLLMIHLELFGGICTSV